MNILLGGVVSTLKESLLALVPLAVFFVLFQWRYLQLPPEFVLRIGKGLVFSWLGLAFFLHGVHIGFLPVGREMGTIMGQFDKLWVIVPIGLLLGFVATIAEPAVRVLGYEVEKASSGALAEGMIIWALALGVALAVSVGLARILLGIPIRYLLIPGYVLALILVRFSEQSFVSIAFDAGGVATGPMTVTFIMAMALGVAEVQEGRDALIDGFGLIALVALVPIVSVLGLGILFSRRDKEEAEETWSSSEPMN